MHTDAHVMIALSLCVVTLLCTWGAGLGFLRLIAYSNKPSYGATLEASNLLMMLTAIFCWPLSFSLMLFFKSPSSDLRSVLTLLVWIPLVMAGIHFASGVLLSSMAWKTRGFGFVDTAELMMERMVGSSQRQWTLLGSLVVAGIIFGQLFNSRLTMPQWARAEEQAALKSGSSRQQTEELSPYWMLSPGPVTNTSPYSSAPNAP